MGKRSDRIRSGGRLVGLVGQEIDPRPTPVSKRENAEMAQPQPKIALRLRSLMRGMQVKPQDPVHNKCKTPSSQMQ